MSVRRLVLIADDDEDILALVRATIERSGHEVMAVADGAAALSAVAERRPDLAVLDIAMPEVDGLEVLRRLRADDEMRDLPVILLTAQAQAADVERGFVTGASAYVRKPFSPRDLATRVDDLLA
jgi:two-component system, OmpR family, response regulator MtrA